MYKLILTYKKIIYFINILQTHI